MSESTPADSPPPADDPRTAWLMRYEAWLKLLARLEIDSRFQGKFSESDAVQQTLLEAWRCWDRFRGDDETGVEQALEQHRTEVALAESGRITTIVLPAFSGLCAQRAAHRRGRAAGDAAQDAFFARQPAREFATARRC
jgi:hypothetical protein